MSAVAEVKKSLTETLTASNVKEELGIDTADSAIDSRLNRYIKVADAYLKGALSENYPPDDERAIELALLIIEDLYDRNSTTVKENSTIEKLKADFILQLKVEGMDDLKSKDTNSET